MPCLFVEHEITGRARYLIEPILASQSQLYRPIETVANPLRSVGDRGWITAAFACLACAFGWSALAPAAANRSNLECLRCGAEKSTLVLDGWCSSCGAELRLALEDGAPREGLECHVCHKNTVMVEV